MRKIAFFVGELSAQYQRELSYYLSERCEKEKIQLSIFHNFSVFGSNVFHSYGERSVIRIPDIMEYDGVILASDTYSVEGMYDELAEYLETEADCPVLSIRRRDDRFYNVLTDDYTAMCELVEHFVTKHGMRRICFMKGLEYLEDAQVRFKAYKDTMEKHGITISKHMVFDGDYWRGKGKQAVNWFLEDQEELPEAIVCANDYMALSVLQALRDRGIKVPEQISVSGFDDVEEAAVTVPSITSVCIANQKFADGAIDLLLNLWAGKKVERNLVFPAKCVYRQSCGCETKIDPNLQFELFVKKEQLHNAILQSSFMYVDFDSAGSVDGLLELASHYVIKSDINEKIYICFCDAEEKQQERAAMEARYTENMVLRAVISHEKAEICNEKFERSMILPERYLEGVSSLYVNALHDKNECLGYVVVTPCISEPMRYFYQMFIEAITNQLVKQKVFSENEALTNLMDEYNLDELTGIPNRRQLDAVLRNAHNELAKENKEYIVVSVDMDGLKLINDKYGHVVGDEALCALARILANHCGETGLAARVGGDEFMICYRSDDEDMVKEQIRGIRKDIEHYNETMGKPYELSASAGQCKCVKGMLPINCIQKADEKMYRQKRRKKGKVRLV